MKRFWSVLLACVLSMTMFSTVSYGDNELTDDVGEIIIEEYAMTEMCQSNLLINNREATCSSAATGNSTVVNITGKQTLEKHAILWQWNPVSGAEWNGYGGVCLSMTNTKSGLTSGTYRLKTVFTLTSSTGTTEEITVYSNEVTI